MLESDIEAIKDIINPHGEKISYLESIVHTAKVHDNFSGRSIWDVASLTSAVGDLRKDFLRLERDLTVISQSNLSVNDRTCKLESELKRIEELVVRNAQVETFWMDQVNGEIAVLKNNLSDNESTLADQVEYHFKIALAEHLEKTDGFSHNIALAQSNLRNDHEILSATVETLRIQHSGLADNFFQTVGKIDADVILVKNELDAIRSRVAGLEKAQISDADWQVLQRAYESIDREIKAAKESIATWDFMRKTYEDLDNRVVDLENGAKPFNPDTLIDSPESNRQEETADPVGYLERLKKKPNTDYTHDIIP